MPMKFKFDKFIVVSRLFWQRCQALTGALILCNFGKTWQSSLPEVVGGQLVQEVGDEVRPPLEDEVVPCQDVLRAVAVNGVAQALHGKYCLLSFLSGKNFLTGRLVHMCSDLDNAIGLARDLEILCKLAKPRRQYKGWERVWDCPKRDRQCLDADTWIAVIRANFKSLHVHCHLNSYSAIPSFQTAGWWGPRARRKTACGAGSPLAAGCTETRRWPRCPHASPRGLSAKEKMLQKSTIIARINSDPLQRGNGKMGQKGGWKLGVQYFAEKVNRVEGEIAGNWNGLSAIPPKTA